MKRLVLLVGQTPTRTFLHSDELRKTSKADRYLWLQLH